LSAGILGRDSIALHADVVRDHDTKELDPLLQLQLKSLALKGKATLTLASGSDFASEYFLLNYG